MTLIFCLSKIQNNKTTQIREAVSWYQEHFTSRQNKAATSALEIEPKSKFFSILRILLKRGLARDDDMPCKQSVRQTFFLMQQSPQN